jgi:hypothetical protein
VYAFPDCAFLLYPARPRKTAFHRLHDTALSPRPRILDLSPRQAAEHVLLLPLIVFSMFGCCVLLCDYLRSGALRGLLKDRIVIEVWVLGVVHGVPALFEQAVVILLEVRLRRLDLFIRLI